MIDLGIAQEEDNIKDLVQFEEVEVPPLDNAKSSKGAAAMAASLSEGDVIGDYMDSSYEFSMTGESSTADYLVKKARERRGKNYTSTLRDILLNPDIDDETKRQVYETIWDDKSPIYDPIQMVAEESLEDENTSDTEESVEQRVSLADSVSDIVEFKRQRQDIMNYARANSKLGAMSIAGDILEMFIPFADQKQAGDLAKGLGQNDRLRSLIEPGATREMLTATLEGMTAKERMEVSRAIFEAVVNNSDIYTSNPNELKKLQSLKEMLYTGEYSATDKWLDNIFGALDIAGVGSLIKGLGRGPMHAYKTRKEFKELQKQVELEQARSPVEPTSVSQVQKDVNSDNARAMHDMAAIDESGEAAESLYGTSRANAISNDLMPEVGVDGAVKNKVREPNRIELSEITPNADVMDFVKNNGYLQYDRAEKAAARSRVLNNFKEATGMTPKYEMFHVEETAAGSKISAVYGPTEQGFSSATDALETAMYALRDYDIKPQQVSILKRVGEMYKPALVNKNGKWTKFEESMDIPDNGNYLIKVEHDYRMSAGDIEDYSKVDVGKNFIDRVFAGSKITFGASTKMGSMQQHILDAASMFKGPVKDSFVTAVDKTAGLEKSLLRAGIDFQKNISSMPKDRVAAINQKIKDANLNSYELTPVHLKAEGFNEKEIETFKIWREAWDAIYHLENRDLARTLRNQGFGVLEDAATDTRLFVKNMSPVEKAGVTKVYDHSEDIIRPISKQEIKALEESGASIMKMRSPVRIADEATEYVINPNQKGGAYVKGIQDHTQVLNYRQGYYTVVYDNPHFIIKQHKDSNGNLLYESAVATAKSKKEAELLTRRMQASEPNQGFYNRLDMKNYDLSSDSHWDVLHASGRSAQKVRGARLEDANQQASIDMLNVVSPAEAYINAARSIARRTEMRDVIDAGWSRFAQQFSDYLPKNAWGEAQIPNKITDIRYRGGHTPNNKEIANARTLYNHLRAQEEGYINHIDDSFKALIRGMSEIAGDAGWAATEHGLRKVSEMRGPIGLLKGSAFSLYLALNPIRQFIVQSHQASQLLAINPKWLLKDAPMQITAMSAGQLGMRVPDKVLKGAGWTREEFNHIVKSFQQSGQAAAIDKQNLVRGMMVDYVDSISMNKAYKVVRAPLEASRKIGFDAGEYINTSSAYLSFYDMAKKQGKNMKDQEVLAKVAADARNFTYNMNSAGDMPYNQNLLSAIFQFMQVPHKGLMTMTTNRSLTKEQRIKLAAFNATMFTLPTATMYQLFGDYLPENKEARDAIVQGLEGYMFNKFLSATFGEDVSLDYSSLSPVDMYGTWELINSLFTADLGEIVAASPSGQMLGGHNPRITNFMKTAARYFNLMDDYEDPTTFHDVAMEGAKLTSGLSNIFKAQYALQYGKKMGGLGGITDYEVGRVEAIATAFGFTTTDEMMKFYASERAYKTSEKMEKDVTIWYNDMKKHLLRRDISPREQEFVQRASSEAWRVWGNDNKKAKDVVRKLIAKDVKQGDARLFMQVMDMAGMSKNSSELKALIRDLPDMSDAERKAAIQSVEQIEKLGEKK